MTTFRAFNLESSFEQAWRMKDNGLDNYDTYNVMICTHWFLKETRAFTCTSGHGWCKITCFKMFFMFSVVHKPGAVAGSCNLMLLRGWEWGWSELKGGPSPRWVVPSHQQCTSGQKESIWLNILWCINAVGNKKSLRWAICKCHLSSDTSAHMPATLAQVGGVLASGLRGPGFETHQGQGGSSLGKMIYWHFLLLRMRV